MKLPQEMTWGLVVTALLLAACDDDAVDPPPSPTTTTGVAGTGGTGAAGGSGGSGAIGGGGMGSGAGGGTGGAAPCEQIPDTATLVTVPLPGGGAMCIDATEVTRGQYETWLGTSPDVGTQPTYCDFNDSFVPAMDWPPNGVALTRPMVNVDWCDAFAYCADNGKRLCGAIGGGAVPVASADDATANEWFNACSEGGQRIFPYGQTYSPDVCNGLEAGNLGTVAVGSMPACRGTLPVFDLSGNVWEWEDSCTGTSGGSDGCQTRGGGYNVMSNHLACTAGALVARDQAIANVGFRCCADPPS